MLSSTSRRGRNIRGGRIASLALAAVISAGVGCATARETAKVVALGDSRQLRKRPERAAPNSPTRPGILVIALDGVDRDLLYGMLAAARLPGLSSLLGGGTARPPHAHLEQTLLATLPSTTMAAWTTAFTGVGPAEHGLSGNEFFVRERKRFVAPIPVSFDDSAPTLLCLTENYAVKERRAPTVYERMRKQDPDMLIWVAMHPIFAGADRLLLADRHSFAQAMEAVVGEQANKVVGGKASRAKYEKLDKEVVDVVLDELESGALPDVVTVYLSGTDLFAHVADEGPDVARRRYLREVMDPLFARIADRLARRGGLANRWIVVTSDHGHTEVERDDLHALAHGGDDDPPNVLRRAGIRVRDAELDVAEDHDFQSVLAYQGAMAFVYVADRSTCPQKGAPCDWRRPPRYREDVLAVAEAYRRASDEGAYVAAMKGTLDMIFVREPRPYAARDLPFQVYVGGGRVASISDYLAARPHPTYVALEPRMRDLAEGPLGERAGDVILLAHNGDQAERRNRFYFASPQRSWHGSPSRTDSEIPLIVAHPALDRERIGSYVRGVLGEQPRQQKVTDLLLALRFGEL
jgi:hypothetical protein